MNKKLIVLIVLAFGALCIIFYCLFPKYEFHYNNSGILRYNRITGEVEVYVPQANEKGWVSVPIKSKK